MSYHVRGHKRRASAPHYMVGKRVELHPGMDLWMRGARYGTIHSVSRDGTYKLRMDNPHVRRLVRVRPEDVTVIS
jgi:hypothetical protein